MSHRDHAEYRRLRASDADATRPGLDDPLDPGQAAFLGKTTGDATPTAGAFFSLNPATITGDEIEGGPATIAVPVGAPKIFSLLWGVEGDPRLTGPVAAGDPVVADHADYRWVAWRPPPPNPHNCFNCIWPATAPWPTLSLADPYQAGAVPLTTTDGVHYTGCGMSSDEAVNTEIALTSSGDPNPWVLTLSDTFTGTHTFGPYASITARGLQIDLEAVYGTGNVFVGGSGGDLSGFPTLIQFVGGMKYENFSVSCSGFLTCTRENTDPGPFPIYYALDLSTCALTIQGITDNNFGTCNGTAPGFTCADLPDPGMIAVGYELNAWTFAATASKCAPLTLTFDTTSGSGQTNFACFYGIGAYRPAPVIVITMPAPPNDSTDLPGPFAWARCLGTRANLSTVFTLTDPFGSGPVTMTYDAAWPLPVHGFNTRAGWWGCGTVVVPNQCASSGTITVPVAYFLDQTTCGFLIYYLAATLNTFDVPNDGCASETAPRAGSCSGGDGAGQSWGLTPVFANTLLPIIGPSAIDPKFGPVGATWITVDSFFPLHISIVVDSVGSRALYGTATPQTLTLTG